MHHLYDQNQHVEIFHRYSVPLDIKFKGSEIGKKKFSNDFYILNEFLVEMMTHLREKKNKKEAKRSVERIVDRTDAERSD